MAAILAFATGISVSLAGAPPAGAHVCSNAIQVPVDRQSTVTVGVPAEAIAVVRVDVGIPKDFRLSEVIGAQFWTGKRVGEVIRFEGGPLAPYSCGYLSIKGTATEKGKLVFPLTLQLEDGTTDRFTSEFLNDPRGAQLVFAGVQPKESDYLGGEESGGGSSLGLAGGILVGIGVAGVLGAIIVRRYGNPTPSIRRARQQGAHAPGPGGSGSSRPGSRKRSRSRRS
jgi:hypothetical protein